MKYQCIQHVLELHYFHYQRKLMFFKSQVKKICKLTFQKLKYGQSQITDRLLRTSKNQTWVGPAFFSGPRTAKLQPTPQHILDACGPSGPERCQHVRDAKTPARPRIFLPKMQQFTGKCILRQIRFRGKRIFAKGHCKILALLIIMTS